MRKEKEISTLESVRAFGGSASEAVLDHSSEIFTTPSLKGVIGYYPDHGCAVVFGDPVCDPKEREPLVQAFHEFCKEKGQNVVYLTASQHFFEWAIDKSHMFSGAIEFGKELFLNPESDPREQQGVKGCLVRRKMRHAVSENVQVHEYKGGDPELEKAIEKVGFDWLKRRHGPQIHTSHIQIFSHRPGKRWFYAEKNGRVIGVLTLNQLKAKKGWLLNRYLVTGDAPGGTPECLVLTAIETLRDEKCSFLNLGTVPGRSLGNIIGLGAFHSFVGRCVFKAANWLFRLEGKRQFWEKFHPESAGSYLLFSQPQIGIAEIKGLMHSMNVTF